MNLQPNTGSPATAPTGTTTAQHGGSSFQQEYATVHAQAVEALTGACRLTFTPVRPDGSRLLAEPVDFANFLASVLAAVAANVGSTERLVAGRPGSWEADLVMRLVTGTVGADGEWLFEHRTAPVVVPLNMLELSWYLPAFPHVDDAVIAATGPLQLHPDWAVAQQVAEHLTPEQWDAWEQVCQDTENAVLDAYASLYAAYGDAFTAAVHRAAADIPGLQVPVRVDCLHDPRDPHEQVAAITNPPGDLDPTADLLAVRLWETAAATVPIPATPAVPLPAVPGWLANVRARHAAARRAAPCSPSAPAPPSAEAP